MEYWTFRCTKWIEGEARIGNFRIEISIRLVISIRLDHVDLQFSYWNFHAAGYFHTDWFNWPVFHLITMHVNSLFFVSPKSNYLNPALKSLILWVSLYYGPIFFFKLQCLEYWLLYTLAGCRMYCLILIFGWIQCDPQYLGFGWHW